MVKENYVADFTFAMKPDSQALEEVVVKALGIKRFREALTASSKGISASQLMQSSHVNTVQSLQGKASGLQINSNNAGVNQTTRIVLRGNRSVSGTNQALIVLDGQKISAETLAKIKSQKIASTHVIKGAGGLALYGSQGANGVIIVSTKGSKYKVPKEVKQHKIQPKTYDNNDVYEVIVENTFENVVIKPLSTFSIDVDKAGYSHLRRMINNG